MRGCADPYQSFMDNTIAVFKCVIGVVVGLGVISLLAWSIVQLVGQPSPRTYTPTILVCNGITVAESVDGFSLESRSGVYVDYRSNVSYTHKGGETCKEFRKED